MALHCCTRSGNPWIEKGAKHCLCMACSGRSAMAALCDDNWELKLGRCRKLRKFDVNSCNITKLHSQVMWDCMSACKTLGKNCAKLELLYKGFGVRSKLLLLDKNQRARIAMWPQLSSFFSNWLVNCSLLCVSPIALVENASSLVSSKG